MNLPKITTSQLSSIPADIRIHAHILNPFVKDDIHFFIGIHIDFTHHQLEFYLGVLTIFLEFYSPTHKASIDHERILAEFRHWHLIWHTNNNYKHFFNIGLTIQKSKYIHKLTFFFWQLRLSYSLKSR